MWCSSEVNLSSFFCFATCRTRSSACDTLSRFWTRCLLCRFVFSSAPVLGSTGSAAGRPVLFVGFVATVTGSDFSGLLIGGFGSSPSRREPDGLAACGSPRDLPVPAQRAWVGARFSDHAGTGRALAFLPLPILPSTKSTASALRICAFRGSMAGPHLPLSTLRRAPHGTLRMTRGQCGSLYLSLYKTLTHCSLPVSRRTDICTRAEPKSGAICPVRHAAGEGPLLSIAVAPGGGF